MTLIEITPEQQREWDSYRPITKPRPTKRYLAVFHTGNTYTFETDKEVKTFASPDSPRGFTVPSSAEGTLVVRGPHPNAVGTKQTGIGGTALAVIEIPKEKYRA